MQETATNQVSNRELLTNRIKEFEGQIKQKDFLEAKYKREVGRMAKNYVPRSSYTQQIMDILKNVARQRNETSKVIDDIKLTQNDINLLEGKLYRTYVDVDASVFHVCLYLLFNNDFVDSKQIFFLTFQLAKNDSQMVPTYRLLTDIHKQCEGIIECIRQTGQVKRATRTAKDQADVERAKNVSANIKQLSKDLREVKAENRQLREKLKQKVDT